ncbi:MAG: copper chaperone PCu(A)C [Devosia nanyangense]|uniref:Copper chaperone PCu(A)C n=1 Tax=Devosia nanyangense TaxID=1228055 RepID=A0A933NYL3_9HYPH|nr:copper chaperone PCu(A)C [Devosia nanyangense]
MNIVRSAALAALLVACAPSLAFAHNGVIHDGCPTGQTFTAGAITVTDAFTRATPKGATAAGSYFTVVNAGAAADTLLGATSEAAADIGAHQMKMNGDVMEMSPVEGGLEIPAGGAVQLAPGGYHLMLTGMDQPFVEGACLEMTLHFAVAGDLPIQLNIGGLGQKVPPVEGDTGDAPPMEMEMSSMEGM